MSEGGAKSAAAVQQCSSLGEITRRKIEPLSLSLFLCGEEGKKGREEKEAEVEGRKEGRKE